VHEELILKESLFERDELTMQDSKKQQTSIFRYKSNFNIKFFNDTICTKYK